jgi:hypothetical protein
MVAGVPEKVPCRMPGESGRDPGSFKPAGKQITRR